MCAKADSSEADGDPRLEWLLVGVVLCIAVIPDLFNAVVVRLREADAPASWVESQFGLIIRALQVSAPIWAIVTLAGLRWQSLGIVRIRWLSDILVGLAIWLVGTMATYWTALLLPDSAFAATVPAGPSGQSLSTLGYGLLALGSLANGFSEELVMRGFLLTRFERLLGSTWLAVLVSSILFASYHLYQGVGATICIGVLGVVYAVAFCLLRRLWPLVIAHAAADFIGWLGAAMA